LARLPRAQRVKRSANLALPALQIFTDKKYEELSPSTHNVDVPNVTRKEYQLVNSTSILAPSRQRRGNLPLTRIALLHLTVDDGFLNMMLVDGTPKDDVKVPEGDIGDQIQAAFDDGQDVSLTLPYVQGCALLV
jgi:translation initiation factor 5A